jgi:tRNA(fMet)-specific endonuclease VapC
MEITMKLLLDTNAYTEMRRGNNEVATLVRKSQAICFSTIVVGELLYGFQWGKKTKQNNDDLFNFLNDPHVLLLNVSLVTADRFARIFAQLRKKGTPIPTNDIWIAAHAMEHGADLVTADAHFDNVAGLVVQSFHLLS